MILVQKPPTLTPSQFPLYARRNHPSIVVLPTRTPGLLNLSQPPRPPLQRQTPKPLPKTKSTPVVRTPLLNSTAEITNNKKSGVVALPATPPQLRGRGQIKHTKDRVHRTPSPSYPAVRRKHRHQPQSEVSVISSSDEDLSVSGSNILNPDVQDLFGLVNTYKPSKMPPSTPVRAIFPSKRNSTSPSHGSLPKEKQSEREGAEKAAGYFASSMFQNSPSPEALPDPLLF